ncbi:MAG TPA: protein kinase [Vicinamibacteria bacterium]
MGLTQKILLFTSLLVVALVATTVGYTTFQANHLAQQTIHDALQETRQVWETFQADRYNKLKLGVRVLANDPYFKAGVEGTDTATVLDTLKERGQDMKADVMMAADAQGIVKARTDRPGGEGEDLSSDPLVAASLEGEESATVWRQGDRLYHTVSVPMQTGPDLKGVLAAGYAINEALATDLRKLTHSEVAFLTPTPSGAPQLSVSSLGPKEPALRAALASPEFGAGAKGSEPFQLGLGSERYVAVAMPLKAASGEAVGTVLALRSLAEEMADFRQFRTSLILASVAVMVLALALAFVVARRIAGPVRRLATVVERAREGKYTGKVAIETRDEIGALAQTFNTLLAELREKEQMIGFLREGMTMLRRGSGVTSAPGQGSVSSAETRAAAATGAAGVTLPPGDWERGTVFAGRYEILSNVGKGGMGQVFRAHDRQLDDVVALKVLRSDVLEDDPHTLDRFKQEIKLARRITHRNVLRTHDFGESDGTPYISMEYLEGVTLKDLVVNKGALPLGVGLRIAKQICQGLEAAHQQGVVHRDIKPQNMLIIPESGELKIMDFGIARTQEVKGEVSGLTTAGTVLGTPDYMPPEQAQGAPADFRSDIYSLGAVLFEVFTGKLPFGGGNITAIILSHIQKPPPEPRSLNPAIPERLERIILRCLEKQPARRYAKVGDVLTDLMVVSTQVDATAA